MQHFQCTKFRSLLKVSKNFVDKGVNAGQIVNEIAVVCEGRGGGKPNFAQAGAKNPARLDEAIAVITGKLLNS